MPDSPQGRSGGLTTFDVLNREIEAHGHAASAAIQKLRTRIETLETREERDRVRIAYLAIALVVTIFFTFVVMGIAIQANLK